MNLCVMTKLDLLLTLDPHDKTLTIRKNSKIIKVVHGWDLNLEGATWKDNALMTEPLVLYGLDAITKRPLN